MLNTLHLRENFGRWFAAITGRVYANRNLTSIDRDVFGVIALCGRGGPEWVEIKQSEVAEFLGLSERAVKRSISRLRAQDEIAVNKLKGGNSYRVVSPVVGRSKTPPAPKAKALTTRTCPQCLRSVKSLGLAGVCRGCAENAALAKQVLSARQTLGSQATPEEIAAHLKNARLAARIRRLMLAA